MKKSRKVIVTLEIATDINLKELKKEIFDAVAKSNVNFDIIQIQANLIKPIKL